MNNYRRYVVEGNPVTKKNSQQIVKNKTTGRWFMVPSRQYKTFEKDALKQLEKVKEPEPITNPVNIRYTFFMVSRRQVDGLNLSAAMDDILVKAGILADDNRDIVAGHDGTRVYLSTDTPKTVIEIWDEENYEQWKQKE
jgi:Holliday junction resolvase RusA-like endonuclease